MASPRSCHPEPCTIKTWYQPNHAPLFLAVSPQLYSPSQSSNGLTLTCTRVSPWLETPRLAMASLAHATSQCLSFACLASHKLDSGGRSACTANQTRQTRRPNCLPHLCGLDGAPCDSVMAHIHGFTPYMYCNVPPNFKDEDVGKFRFALEQALRRDRRAAREVSELKLLLHDKPCPL